MESHRKAALDETASPMTRLRSLILLGGGILILLLLALTESDAVLRTLYLIWAGILLLLTLLELFLSRRCRCIMTATGVTLDGQHLPWSDIRTAAVIRLGGLPPMLCRYPDERHFILLSVQPPEEAIDKWHFRMETALPGQELRISYTRRRTEIIGQHLRMPLPEYRT